VLKRQLEPLLFYGFGEVGEDFAKKKGMKNNLRGF